MIEKEKTVTKLDSNYVKNYDAHVDRQRRKKKRLVRRIVVFFTLCFFIFGGLATYHINQRFVQADKKEQHEKLQKKQAQLEKEEKALKDEIKLLKDEEYVLEIARTNYFFSKKGEKIFKIPDKDPTY